MPVKAGQARCLIGHPASVVAGEPRGSDVPSDTHWGPGGKMLLSALFSSDGERCCNVVANYPFRLLERVAFLFVLRFNSSSISRPYCFHTHPSSISNRPSVMRPTHRTAISPPGIDHQRLRTPHTQWLPVRMSPTSDKPTLHQSHSPPSTRKRYSLCQLAWCAFHQIASIPAPTALTVKLSAGNGGGHNFRPNTGRVIPPTC